VRDDHRQRLGIDLAVTVDRERKSPLTIVEDVQAASAEHAQAPVARVMKARGSRRPRLSPAEKREITRLYGDTSTSTSEICARLGIGESSLYRIIQLQGLPLRGRTASSTSPGTTPRARAPYTSRNRSSNAGRDAVAKRASTASTSGGAVTNRAMESEVKQIPEPAAQPTVAPIAGAAKSINGRRRTAPVTGRSGAQAPIETTTAGPAPVLPATRRSRTAGVARSTELRQYTVAYLAEETLQAASALEALQLAQARGATEVTSIVRIA
jgi:transposase-like protein